MHSLSRGWHRSNAKTAKLRFGTMVTRCPGSESNQAQKTRNGSAQFSFCFMSRSAGFLEKIGTTLETRSDESKNLSKVFESDFWGYSSVGRAVALQAIGLGFESPCLHQTSRHAGLDHPS